MDRDAQIPGALALRTGRPVFTEPERAPSEDYPDLARLPVHASTATLVAFPSRRRRDRRRPGFSGARRRGLDETEREVSAPSPRRPARHCSGHCSTSGSCVRPRCSQRGLLPQRLPAVPGIAMAARYAPRAAGLRVGGDWYDAIPVPGTGSPWSWATSWARACTPRPGWRRSATPCACSPRSTPSPPPWPPGWTCSPPNWRRTRSSPSSNCCWTPRRGRLDRPARAPSATAGAGLRAAGGAGRRRFAAARGAGGRREQAPLRVEAGSLLVFFTDGLVEDRRTGLDVGLPALTATGSAAGGRRPRRRGVRRRPARSRRAGRDPPDDVCCSSCAAKPSLRSAPGEPLDAAVTLAADPPAAAPPRFVQRTLAGVRADPERVDILVLLCSELVTNAVLHAAGPSQMRLRVRDGRVRLEVHDPRRRCRYRGRRTSRRPTGGEWCSSTRWPTRGGSRSATGCRTRARPCGWSWRCTAETPEGEREANTSRTASGDAVAMNGVPNAG